MTTKQELIDQVEALRGRCETARDQLWQRYLINTDNQRVHKLCGDFSGLLGDIRTRQSVIAQGLGSSVFTADVNWLSWADGRLEQLLDRVRDAGIELPVLALAH